MRFFRELGKGMAAYPQALQFIRQHSLWAYVLIPAILNLLIFLVAGVLIWHYSTTLSNWVIGWMGIDMINGTLGTALNWLFFLLVKLLSLLLYFKLYRYTILLLSAPALALLAERTQEVLTGISHPFSWPQLGKDVLRGLGITLRNLMIELALTIPLYLLALIPFLSPFATLIILIIESYFVGFSMLDYRSEFLRLSAQESRRLVSNHRGLAIGNGLAFNVLLLIPFIGVLVAPGLGAVAASLAANQVMTDAVKSRK